MKLHIENFAKISSADILLDGLTVVAGGNNTGKSTVGKALYAFFRALSNIDKRVRTERYDSVKHAFDPVLGNDMVGDIKDLLASGRSVEQITRQMIEAFWKEGAKLDFPMPDDSNVRRLYDAVIENVKDAFEKAKRTSNDEYMAKIVLRVFDCTFHQQILPLRKYAGASKLVLTVQGVENSISFQDRPARMEIDAPTKLIKKVRLISTPDVLPLINVRDFGKGDNDSRYFDKHTFELVKELRENGRAQSTSGRIATEKSLEAIYVKLNKIVRGSFGPDEQLDFALMEEGNAAATKAANLSMGLKFFVLLRHMLECGVLSEKDVLILDEPENHLHPEWQIAYANILVLLQKAFKLTLLVTSHSQFFVNALQRFAVSEGVAKDTHFYISREDEASPGFYTFDDKGVMAGPIYRSFNRAYTTLSEMSSEPESGDEAE